MKLFNLEKADSMIFLPKQLDSDFFCLSAQPVNMRKSWKLIARTSFIMQYSTFRSNNILMTLYF